MADRPKQGAAVNDLRALANAGRPQASDLFKYVLNAPPELSGMDPWRIDQIANDPRALL